MEKTQNKIIISLVLFLGMLFALPFFAKAATMDFSPVSGSASAGSYFTVTIYVASPNQAMNGVSGTISFPTNLLSVSSLSQSGSIIGIWAEQPTFSNTNGTINFEGVAISPGFTGNNGRILSVVFKAKAPGIANIKFTSGSVLANDGLGTDITDGLGSSQFTITPSVLESVPTIPIATSTTQVSSSPVLASTSQNIPNQTALYCIPVTRPEIHISLLIALLVLLIILISYLLRKTYRTKKEFSDMILHADKLAAVKFKYFSEYVNAQIDDLEKDAKVKFIPGYSSSLEELKKRITDYKEFIDKDKK